VLQLSSDFRAEIFPGPNPASTVVRVVGEIDMLTAPSLRAVLKTACEGSRHTVVDMAGVEFMGSAGITALLGAADHARDCGGTLTLQNPARIVRRVMDIVSIEGQLPIEDEIDPESSAQSLSA
jgi:anti-anti-sigma factor